MTRARWMALAATAFVLGLIAQAPAASLLGWFLPKDPPPPVELRGIEGSIAHGRAAGVLLNGQVLAQDLRWSLAPLNLLLGELAADVDAKAEGLIAEGRVARRLGGRLRLADFTASGSLPGFLKLARQNFLPVDGAARLNARELVIVDGWPTRAETTLDIQGLAWTLAREPLLLGDYRAVVTTVESGLRADLSSVSGPLELSGEAQLAPDRSYTATLQLKPKPEANSVLRNLLAGSSSPDPQGVYRIKKSGKLP